MKKNEDILDFLRYEILGLLLIGFSIILITSFFLGGGGYLQIILNTLSYFVGSIGIFFFAFFICYFGFVAYKKLNIIDPAFKTVGFLLIFISTLAIFSDINKKLGGIIGFFLNKGFESLVGIYGKFILAFILFIIGFLLVFEILFSDLYVWFLNGLKKIFFNIKFYFSKVENDKKSNDYSDNFDVANESKNIVETLIENEIENNNKELEKDDANVLEDNFEIEIDNDAFDDGYRFPPIDLLNEIKKSKKEEKSKKIESKGKLLIDTLKNFKIDAKIINITQGPTVTRYEIQPASGVKVSRIVSLINDIGLALASANIRIEAPIPGKSAIGIEVPNDVKEIVSFKEVVSSETFKNLESPLAFGLGKGLGNNIVVSDLKQMPHLLIAGATGSGKSVCINTMLCSFLYKANPEDVKLILIDPKMVELSVYKDIPHLLTPVITDPKDAAFALKWAVDEMERRYKILSDVSFRNIEGYNNFILEKEVQDEEIELEKMPYIAIVIDELADLMMIAKDAVEQSICRIAQKARAVGIHLIVATQRPSVDVITGLIKANLPSRISFSVSSQADSRTILDMKGAEKLLGKGDMLFMPIGSNKPIRIQGAFISDSEVIKITDFLKLKGKPEYLEDITMERELDTKKSGSSSFDPEYVKQDDYLEEAIRLVVENNMASISMLQRKLRVGHARAARLMDIMEEMGIVSGADKNKMREVLIDKSKIDELFKKKREDT